MVMMRLRILTKEERDLLVAAKSNKDFVKTFIEKFGWDVFHPTTLMGIYTHKKEYLKKYDESVLKTALPKDPPVFKREVVDSLPLVYRALAQHLGETGRMVIEEPPKIPIVLQNDLEHTSPPHQIIAKELSDAGRLQILPKKSVVLPISEKKMEKTVEELLVEILNEMKLLNSFAGRVKKP